VSGSATKRRHEQAHRATVDALCSRVVVDNWNDSEARDALQEELRSFVDSASTETLNRVNGLLAETDASVRAVVRESLHYVGWLLASKCAPDLLALRLYPNVKEWTESAGAYHAVQRHLVPHGWDLSDGSIHAVCVGDGCTPRTGGLFAFRSGWSVHSVDPKIRQRDVYRRVDRLEVVPSRVQDWRLSAERVVVLAVHAHVGLPESLASIEANEVAVVAIPCCEPLTLPQPPDIVYRDHGILSPQNSVRVWRRVGGGP
jgi:hypothetical protein